MKVEYNLVIGGKVVIVDTKNPFWKTIPVKGELCMTFFIQEKRELMLGGQDFEKLVLESFEIRREEFKIFLSRLTSNGNPFSLFDIFNLE